MFGEEARSRNHRFLWRRLAWRLQELEEGGLSERARRRAVELSKGLELRQRPPRGWTPPTGASCARSGPGRDPRLPKPGTELVRQYHGQDVRVRVGDQCFVWEGREYKSLSAVAKAITGQHLNGRLFFGLTKRKRGEK